MKRIGIISDTHGTFDDCLKYFLKDVDEIWHAGDIGNIETAESIAAFKPLKAVYGNIDGGMLRRRYSEVLRFTIEECSVMMKHIGGYPGRYDASIRRAVYSERPMLFVSGHSHILKVQYDGIVGCLHINPGAAGRQGWHQARTLVKLTIDGKEFKDLEVVELADPNEMNLFGDSL